MYDAAGKNINTYDLIIMVLHAIKGQKCNVGYFTDIEEEGQTVFCCRLLLVLLHFSRQLRQRQWIKTCDDNENVDA